MQRAFVLINCDLGSEASLIKELNQLDTVKESHGTFGPYDIVSVIETDNQDKIRKTISDHIRMLEHIRSTTTLMEVGNIEDLQPLPDIIPDVIPDEKKPLEPPDEVDDEEYDDDEDEEDFSDKNLLRDKDYNFWNNLTEEEFRKIFKNSAVKRTKYSGLKRNISTAKEQGEV